MKPITALAQPLVDLLIHCDHDFLKHRGLTPGSYGMVDAASQAQLIEACRSFQQSMHPGGSAANSISCARALGVPCNLIGLIGKDEFGETIRNHFSKLGATLPTTPTPHIQTGTCVSLITPDGERTMLTSLAAAAECSPDEIDSIAIAASSWLLTESYFLTGSERNKSALYSAIEVAKRSQTKLAFPILAEFVVHRHRDEIMTRILPDTALLLANEQEALCLTDASSAKAALDHLATKVPSVVITGGSRGAFCFFNGETFFVPAFTEGITALDTTGAGDTFAGALLAGLELGYSPLNAARGAARLAADVVTRNGAKIHEDALTLFKAAAG